MESISTCKPKHFFEILESEEIENISSLKERITFLTNFGYVIAIDDVRKGGSSLNMIIELEPHYIKLDKYFSINLSKSMNKQEMIKSFLTYAQYSKSVVILEGIEKFADLATAKSLSIPICHGFLLDKPKTLSI